MDDVDGALFSRVPVRGSETDLNSPRHLNRSKTSLINECCKEGNYTKLDKPKKVSQINGNENESETGKRYNDDIIIKRKSVQVFRSMPPKDKGTVNNLVRQKTPEVPFRGSAPCELNKKSIEEPADVCKTHIRAESVNLSPERPLFIITNDQQKSSTVPRDSRLTNLSDCVQNESAKSLECKEVNKSGGELRRDVRDEVKFSTSNSEGSSFGDVDSNWEDDPRVVAELPSVFMSSDKASDTEHGPGLEEKLLKEPDNTPSRVSSVFYLNEDETFTDTNVGEMKKYPGPTMNKIVIVNTNNDLKLNMPINKVNKKTVTCSVDSTDGKSTHISEPVNRETNSEKLVHADDSENEIMLTNDVNTKRRTPVFCRVILALAFPIVSLIIYIWDIGSDIRLAIAYKDQGDRNLFWITLACIVFPLILMSVVDVSWLWLDRPPSRPSHIVRYILGVFTLGRVIRSVIYMWHTVKSLTLSNEEERVWHKNRATEEKRDCYMLDFINAFAESVPQLFVQLYLMYAFDLELTAIRILNLLSSWASIAWTYSAYYRCNREILIGKQELNIIGFTIFLTSVLSALAARVICVVLFLVYFKAWIGCVVLTVHFILTLLWIVFREKPMLEGTTPWKLGKYLYCVFFAYVSLLCFLNLRNSRAKLRMVFFYLLIYTENFTMAALSFYKIYVSQTGNEKLYNLLALPVGFILHISLLVTYYQIFHPKTGMCR